MIEEEHTFNKKGLTDLEKSEFDQIRKKLNYYWNSILYPTSRSLAEVDVLTKEAALDDYFQKQNDYKPTDEEINKLKDLAHKDPQYDPLLPVDLLTIEELENQILNRLRS